MFFPLTGSSATQAIDALIYSPTGQNPSLFPLSYPEWNNKYLPYSAGKIFQRCGSDELKDPDAWKVTTVATPGQENACSSKKL